MIFSDLSAPPQRSHKRSQNSKVEPRSASMGDDTCYICLQGEECGSLASSPCACRGTCGHVHKTCLVKYFEARDECFDLKCPSCKQDYHGTIRVEMAEFAVRKVKEEHGDSSEMTTRALMHLSSARYKAGNFGGTSGRQRERSLFTSKRTAGIKTKSRRL